MTQSAIVRKYNKIMGNVDIRNMLIELYRIDFKSKTCYLRIIFHIIDMWVENEANFKLYIL